MMPKRRIGVTKDWHAPKAFWRSIRGFAFLEVQPANCRDQYSDEWTTPRTGDRPVYCCSFGALAPALAPDCSVDSLYSVPCKKITVNCLLPSGSVLMT